MILGPLSNAKGVEINGEEIKSQSLVTIDGDYEDRHMVKVDKNRVNNKHLTRKFDKNFFLNIIKALEFHFFKFMRVHLWLK